MSHRHPRTLATAIITSLLATVAATALLLPAENARPAVHIACQTDHGSPGAGLFVSAAGYNAALAALHGQLVLLDPGGGPGAGSNIEVTVPLPEPVLRCAGAAPDGLCADLCPTEPHDITFVLHALPHGETVGWHLVSAETRPHPPDRPAP